MKKFNYLALLLVGLIFWACGGGELPSEYRGYKKLQTGIHYKYFENKDGEAPAEGDLVEFNSVILKNDYVMSSSYNQNQSEFRLMTGEKTGTPIERVLPLMSKGDSLSVVILVDSLEKLPKGFVPGEWMEIRVKCEDLISKKERTEIAKQSIANLDKHPNGLFYWKQYKNTGGQKAQQGDEVQFYMTLRRGDKVNYSTRKGLPDMISIPKDARNISPLHIVMQEMAAGDSVTAAFEISRLAPDMQLSMQQSQLYPGDFMVMDVGVISVKDEATKQKELAAAQAKVEKEKADAIRRGKQQDVKIPQLIKQYQAKKLKLEKTPAGVQYLIHEKGTGPVVKKGQTVSVHYTGFLTNSSKKFDSSLDKGLTLNFEAGQGKVIRGWDDVILKFPIGTKATIFIPYHLAYGEQGRGEVIPPYANLTFYIEVLGVR